MKRTFTIIGLDIFSSGASLDAGLGGGTGNISSLIRLFIYSFFEYMPFLSFSSISFPVFIFACPIVFLSPSFVLLLLMPLAL